MNATTGSGNHRSARPAVQRARRSLRALVRGAPLALGVVLLVGAACGDISQLPDGADVGPNPALPEPDPPLMPTVNIAPAEPWPEGETPVAAQGLQVRVFAKDLQHPRWVTVLPGGDVLVAETTAPERPLEHESLKATITKFVKKLAGAGTPRPDRISLLRDADGDGQPELRTVFLEGLNSPFGMVLVGDRLYVANTDAVLEYPYTPGMTRMTEPPRRLTELPAGRRNHHWTKNLIASPDGKHLYATVGSNSNVAENGLQAEDGRAAIWEIDRASGRKRLFATGLRNPNGMAFTRDGMLWTVVNERDELGSDVAPDYLTSVRDGAFYGWPYSWWGGRHVDKRVQPQRPDLVQRAVEPDYALGAHVAPLGLVAAPAGPLVAALGARPIPVSTQASHATAGMFVGLHGSWNRRPHSGYKVVFVPFVNERPHGMPVDVLDGFLSPEGRARGRPVGVALDAHGGLLVADDVGNTVWRVTPLH